MKISHFTIGTDFEVVAMSNNSPVSVIGMIGGTKHDPLWVDGGNLQEDNVLAEGATNPVSGRENFVEITDKIKTQLESKLQSIGMTGKYIPTARYGMVCLSHPKAKEFGCDPDYNAWTRKKNPCPTARQVGTLRTAGGHVSIGYDHQRDFVTMTHIVKCLDMFLAIPMLFVDPDRERRSVYGQAGSFRPKDFGVEYRALSNAWVGNNLTGWVYDKVQYVLENHENIEVPDAVRGIIDSYNLSAAELIMSKYNLETAA